MVENDKKTVNMKKTSRRKMTTITIVGREAPSGHSWNRLSERPFKLLSTFIARPSGPVCLYSSQESVHLSTPQSVHLSTVCTSFDRPCAHQFPVLYSLPALCTASRPSVQLDCQITAVRHGSSRTKCFIEVLWVNFFEQWFTTWCYGGSPGALIGTFHVGTQEVHGNDQGDVPGF